MPVKINPSPTPDQSAEEQKRINALIKKPQFTPEEAEQVRALLLGNPSYRNQFGHLAEFAVEQTLENFTNYAVTRQALKLEIEDLRQSLTRVEDSAFEKLLIEQCINAYVHHYVAEARYAMVSRRGENSSDYYWETRMNASQRRFLRCLEALARIRRAPVSPVQINIAETQTNISTGSPSPLTESAEKLPEEQR